MAYADEQHHHDRHPARYIDDPMEPPTLSDPTLLPLNVPHYFHGRYRSDVVDAGNLYPDPTGAPLVPTRACVPTAIQQCS